MRCLATTLAALAVIPTLGRAADQPDWRPMLGDLAQTEKAGYGGLCGVVVDHDTGTIRVPTVLPRTSTGNAPKRSVIMIDAAS